MRINNREKITIVEMKGKVSQVKERDILKISN